MSITFKKIIPTLIASIIGMIIIIEYFAPPLTILLNLKSLFTSWAVLIGAFTMLLGAIYLIRFHLLKIEKSRFKQDGIYSIILLLTFLLFISVSLVFGGTQTDEYSTIYMNIIKPVAQVVRALCFFYCISAAYRAFNIGSIETASLLIAGVIHAFRQIPMIPMLWPPILQVGDWILNYPNVASTRGAIIANAIGAIIVGVRTLYGKEISLVGRTGTD